MKSHKLLIFLLAFCLSGCTLDKNTQNFPTQTEQSTSSEVLYSSESIITSEIISPSEENTPPETSLPPQEPVPPAEPNDEDFVLVKTYIPDIVVDLRYATENNFTNQKIYNFTDAWLRYGTVKKLLLIQEELKQHKLSLKIWDGFRPTSAQFKLWDVFPDSTYVANPNNGFSSHSRGNTIDITLVSEDGTELVMPTAFDDFSKLADRDYSDCDAEAASNALFLENLMIKYGFKPYFGEWWHFTDTNSYPVDKNFEPQN